MASSPFPDVDRAFPHAELGVTPRASATGALMREHALWFTPVAPAAGCRAVRDRYELDQCEALHRAVACASGKARTALLKAYGTTLPALRRAAPLASDNVGSDRARPMNVLQRLQAILDDLDGAMTELDAEKAALTARLAEVERKTRALKAIAKILTDETPDTVH